MSDSRRESEGSWPCEVDVEHFDAHGWVLVRDVLPMRELEAARGALLDLDPSPEAMAAGRDDPAVARYAAARSRTARTAPRRAFHPDQYLGLREFPTGALPLDTVPFHPRLIELAERALGTRDVRLYQAETYAKYHGVADYEQPLHIDYTNHALLPPRICGRPVQIQLFLYLSDVTAGSGPPQIVSRQHTSDIPLMDLAFHRAQQSGRSAPEHEVAAIAPRGSALVYASDVAHRGTAITTPGEGRFTFNLGYRRADTEWAGGAPYARKGNELGWSEMIGALTPRQLELLGIPSPGDSYWTTETLDGAAERYPTLDLDPWREALSRATR